MIVDHPTERFEGETWEKIPCKVVECQDCRRLARPAQDEHGAVTKAREDGFKTTRGATFSSPRRWSCGSCKP